MNNNEKRIKIIEQNINQNKKFIGRKYYDYLKDDNFYKKILRQNADIIVLNEVIEPKNIIDNIERISPNKYNYKCNVKELTYQSRGVTGIQNKIMILFDKTKFLYVEDSFNENLYSIDKGLDFLHIRLKDVESKKEYNIIGIRIYKIADFDAFEKYRHDPNNENKLKKVQDSNKKPMNTLKELIEYAKDLDNVIITGDFNNGMFNVDGKYESYKYYNYHEIYKLINEEYGEKFKLLTNGVSKDENGKLIFNENDWTHMSIYNETQKKQSPLDHYIISKNLNYKLDICKDAEIEYYAEAVYCKMAMGWGQPDHRIIILEIA